MTPPPTMPSLPGMFYDHTTNRYYKLPTPNWRPPSAPQPAPKPPRRNLQPLLTALHSTQGSIPALSATLLSRAKKTSTPTSPSLSPSSSRTALLSAAGSTALVTPCGTVEVRHFPSGACIGSVRSAQPVVDTCWSEASRMLGVAVCGPGKTKDTVRLVDLADGEEAGRDVCEFLVRAKVSCIGMSERDDAMVGTGVCTQVFKRRAAGVERTAVLVHRDRSPGLVTLENGVHGVVSGTRAGSVFGWDVRCPSARAAFEIGGGRKGCSVTDLKRSVRRHRLYVSRLRNGEGNLAAWDVRMVRDGMPVVSYLGHGNCYKRLGFDVEEGRSGGVVVAGGDDGVVRVWGAERGGAALREIGFDGELAVAVRLVCWGVAGGDEGVQRPGLWVVTDGRAYVLEVGVEG